MHANYKMREVQVQTILSSRKWVSFFLYFKRGLDPKINKNIKVFVGFMIE